jgi:transmembrane sensor
MRFIQVDAGEALFSVHPDASRPFRVASGTLVAEDVGTVFDIYKTPHHYTRLVVVEGRVRVLRRRAGSPGLTPLPEVYAARQQIDMPDDLEELATEERDLSSEYLSSVTAWVRGDIELYERPLWQAIEELSRYNPVVFKFSDSRIANVMVGGVIQTNGIDGFLGILQHLCIGYRVEKSDSGIQTYWVQPPSKHMDLPARCKR